MIKDIKEFAFHDKETKAQVEMLIKSRDIFPASRRGIIFHGEYGTGKTTLARLMPYAIDLARGCHYEFGMDLELQCRAGYLRASFPEGLGGMAETADHADQRETAQHDECRAPPLPAGRNGQIPRQQRPRQGRGLCPRGVKPDSPRFLGLSRGGHKHQNFHPFLYEVLVSSAFLSYLNQRVVPN